MLLAVCALMSFSVQDEKLPANLRSLVEAERAFAKLSTEKGIRASFLANFAETGVVFQPAPTTLKEAYANRPAPPQPPPVLLEWAPMVGDVSEAGDMGYTTGPVIFTDKSSEPHKIYNNMYFSVWQRADRKSTWKVIVDIGVSLPSAVAPLTTPFTNLGYMRRGIAYPKTEADQVKGFDIAMSKQAKSESVEQAYYAQAATYCRLHEDEKMPLVGRDVIGESMKGTPFIPVFMPTAAGVAQSNDLAYTYGSYELMKGSEKVKHGYYVHVWKLLIKEGWKLVAEIRKEAPTE